MLKLAVGVQDEAGCARLGSTVAVKTVVVYRRIMNIAGSSIGQLVRGAM
jgi:hypothetical protein